MPQVLSLLLKKRVNKFNLINDVSVHSLITLRLLKLFRVRKDFADKWNCIRSADPDYSQSRSAGRRGYGSNGIVQLKSHIRLKISSAVKPISSFSWLIVPCTMNLSG